MPLFGKKDSELADSEMKGFPGMEIDTRKVSSVLEALRMLEIGSRGC